jgi:hypothetical protein
MIKIAVVSFVTGFLVVALVLAGSVLALTMFADVQGWDSFALGKGPFTIFEYRRTSKGIETLFGVGIVTVAALAGTLNAGAALWLRSRMLRNQH